MSEIEEKIKSEYVPETIVEDTLMALHEEMRARGISKEDYEPLTIESFEIKHPGILEKVMQDVIDGLKKSLEERGYLKSEESKL